MFTDENRRVLQAAGHFGHLIEKEVSVIEPMTIGCWHRCKPAGTILVSFLPIIFAYYCSLWNYFLILLCYIVFIY